MSFLAAVVRGTPRRVVTATLVAAAFVAAITSVGCGANAPRAKMGGPTPVAIAPKGEIERYELSPAHMKVEVEVSAGSSYTIRFPLVHGTFSFDPDAPEASTVQVGIDTTKAESTIQLAADIARKEFLHSAQHPSASFTSTSMRKNETGGIDLYGLLNLHGTEKSLSTPATIAADACKIAMTVEFSIDRRAFGAISSGTLDSLVSDSVVVRIVANVPRRNEGAVCPKPGEPAAPPERGAQSPSRGRAG